VKKNGHNRVAIERELSDLLPEVAVYKNSGTAASPTEFARETRALSEFGNRTIVGWRFCFRDLASRNIESF
jgi:hypothetical protein